MTDQFAVARRWVELYNERSDAVEFVSLLDPEVELQTPGGPRLRGHDQARNWFERDDVPQRPPYTNCLAPRASCHRRRSSRCRS
jgi:hypothetical protein